MKTSCVHHLAVVVEDLDAAARFYGDVLGLEERKRWFDNAGALRSIWYGLGDEGPFLAVERGARRQDDAGWHCVALSIDASHREAWRAHLKHAGHAVYRETDFTLYVRDPEGNILGLSHYPKT
ncbi:MAG: VOC family protein [Myxococcota bacterium]